MKKLNPCCTGDTLVLTENGPVRFDELAKKDNDILVYCYNETGKIVLSKMFHPRLTGHKQTIVKISLSNGVEIKVTPNHQILTDNGYVSADELFEDDSVIVDKYRIDIMQEEIDTVARLYSETESTKKGTLLKSCEVCGKEFEVDWDEREVCSDLEHQHSLYFDVIQKIQSNIENATKDYQSVTIDKIEFLNEKEDVYNGTVAKFHNYFIVDDKTNTMINQLNCGEVKK